MYRVKWFASDLTMQNNFALPIKDPDGGFTLEQVLEECKKFNAETLTRFIGFRDTLMEDSMLTETQQFDDVTQAIQFLTSLLDLLSIK